MNTLEYAISLSTGAFMSGLSRVSSGTGALVSKMGALTGVGAAIGAGIAGVKGMLNVVEGVESAIERGAGLQKLSDTTGVAVASLYRLQAGLKVVDVDAANAGPMILRMQRALGGVSEEGEPTAAIFSQIGLSIQSLKQMDAPEAFSAIAAALGKFDQSSAAFAASKIFGRGAGEDILRVARGAKDFSGAASGAGAGAAQMARYASAFDDIEKSATKAKGKINSLFTGVAGGVAPGIQAVIDNLEDMDLRDTGEKIGVVFGGLIQAFRDGQLADVIGQSFVVGFDAGWPGVLGGMAKIGIVLLNILKTPFTYLQALIEIQIQSYGRFLGALHIPGFASFRKEYTPPAKILKERKEEGMKLGYGEGMSLTELSEGVDAFYNKAMAEGKKKLAAMYDGTFKPLNDKLIATLGPKGKSKATGEPQKKELTLGAGAGGGLPKAMDLAKIGFVFRGGSIANAQNREIAMNTRRTAELLAKIVATSHAGSGYNARQFANIS
jgi:hypothetical protein